MEFPILRSRAHLLPTDPEGDLTQKDLRLLLCSDCPFFKEDQDEDLECGAYRLVGHLLKKKVVTVKAILDAIKS